MKFKVGDKVRFIGDVNNHHGKNLSLKEDIEKYKNKFTISYVGDRYYEFKENPYWYIQQNEIEIIEQKQFAKSDLQDGDIVTYRNGDRRVVTKKETSLRGIKDYMHVELSVYKEDLRRIGSDTDKDITKVERPIKYETVFEREEILDEVEKKWLKHFIDSTGIKVKFIEKWLGASCENEYLEIEYSDYYTSSERIFLPTFKKGTKYKNMKKNKQYTLEELGL